MTVRTYSSLPQKPSRSRTGVCLQKLFLSGKSAISVKAASVLKLNPPGTTRNAAHRRGLYSGVTNAIAVRLTLKVVSEARVKWMAVASVKRDCASPADADRPQRHPRIVGAGASRRD